MSKDIFNSIKTKGKIIRTTEITLLIAFICCSVYDDARMKEDYEDIKKEILQKHSKQPTDVASNAKPTGLSPELKKKLFDTGIGYFEKEDTVEKLKKVIEEKANDKSFSKESGEFPALLNKLKGDYKEDFIHGNFKLEKIKLEAEEAIKAIPDTLGSGAEPPKVEGGVGSIKQEKERFKTELQKAYDSYFELLLLCMYETHHQGDKKVVAERIVDFFKGTPDDHEDSIISVLEHIEAIKNMAIEFKTCISTPKTSDNNGGHDQVPECSRQAEQIFKRKQNKEQEVALVAR